MKHTICRVHFPSFDDINVGYWLVIAMLYGSKHYYVNIRASIFSGDISLELRGKLIYV